jgi:hypothetical protein
MVVTAAKSVARKRWNTVFTSQARARITGMNGANARRAGASGLSISLGLNDCRASATIL